MREKYPNGDYCTKLGIRQTPLEICCHYILKLSLFTQGCSRFGAQTQRLVFTYPLFAFTYATLNFMLKSVKNIFFLFSANFFENETSEKVQIKQKACVTKIVLIQMLSTLVLFLGKIRNKYNGYELVLISTVHMQYLHLIFLFIKIILTFY